jgi:orotidine-5'-phosphate decarboxylase
MRASPAYAKSVLVTAAMFVDKLRRVWSEKDTLLCVGLDPEPARFPALFRESKQAILDFNRAIIDATAG